MSSSSLDNRVIDIATPEWCWTRLRDADEGILSYRTLRGPIALVVLYTVADQLISLPVEPFNDAGWLAAGGDGTLEVSGVDDGLRWVVRASGPVRRTGLLNPPTPQFSRRSHPANGQRWRPEPAPPRLVLAPARVRGFYETALQPDTTTGHGPG